MKTLTEIALFYKTDKCIRHNYIQNFYTPLFKKLRNKKLNILEIGIYNGGSLYLWRDYFTNANIYGIDILDKSKYNSDRISTEICDQKKCNNIFPNINFDIIIDDGSHKWEDQQISFNILFDRLNEGGMYIIEDLHTSYIESFGSNEYMTTLEVMKNKPNTEIFYDINKGIISLTLK